MEALKFLAGYPPCDVAGRMIELNLISFSATVRRILKVPRCPDCSDEHTCAVRHLFSEAYAAQLARFDTTTLSDALRARPRAYGTMQKAQNLSQPSAIFTKPRWRGPKTR